MFDNLKNFPLDSAGANKPKDEATGYSDKFSFEEAFNSAVSNLPKYNPPVADYLDTIHVSDIGAEYGGIAGLNRMFVKVVRYK